MKNYWREVTISLIIVGSFVAMMSLETIHQNSLYHNFADTRSFLGVPNFFDVTSNILFALIGMVGFNFSLKNRQKEAPWSWLVFFSGVTMVCFGSAYYHWNPNNDTLVWDRLPMTIGFMGLFIGLLSECVNSKIERLILVPAIVFGFSSVIYWHYYDDLRFYYWIQLIPLLTIPVVLIVFRNKYTQQKYLLVALALYLLAKVFEAYDEEIFLINYQQFSGHSFKHVLAALASLTIYLLLKRRRSR